MCVCICATYSFSLFFFLSRSLCFSLVLSLALYCSHSNPVFSSSFSFWLRLRHVCERRQKKPLVYMLRIIISSLGLSVSSSLSFEFHSNRFHWSTYSPVFIGYSTKTTNEQERKKARKKEKERERETILLIIDCKSTVTEIFTHG
jgi:hypothetical protein